MGSCRFPGHSPGLDSPAQSSHHRCLFDISGFIAQGFHGVGLGLGSADRHSRETKTEGDRRIQEQSNRAEGPQSPGETPTDTWGCGSRAQFPLGPQERQLGSNCGIV